MVREKLLQDFNAEGRVYAFPFVKWAGGKGQLLNVYSSFVPDSFHNYHEPFVGGGALFFNLHRKGLIKKAYLNDSNSELINLYLCIREHIGELCAELEKHEAQKLNKQYYYAVRNLDRNPESFAKLTSVQRAARTLFLNKTCFNGLYRVNKKGQFNVPFGNYKNPNILDKINLYAVRQVLRKAVITSVDFQHALQEARSGDLIYLDPPYHPISTTASFTSYTENSFSFQDQERLAQTFRDLDKKGCFLMLSNSYTEPILQLYKGYRSVQVTAKRAINCKGNGRGAIPELLVLNY